MNRLIYLAFREVAKDVVVPIAVAAIAAFAVVKAAAIANTKTDKTSEGEK